MTLLDKVKSIFLKEEKRKGLFSMEWLTLLYMGITLIMTFYWWKTVNDPIQMVMARVVVTGVMGLLLLLYHYWPSRFVVLLRYTILMLALIQWYPETYEFCKQFNYLDHFFASIDFDIFGFQPAIEFSKRVSSTFWSEAFCLGYYSYYYIMVATLVYYLFAEYERFNWAGFVFFASFFAFYFIYEFLPVAGPQYYYSAIGEEYARNYYFPETYHYFAEHTDALTIEIKGFFSQLVVGAQEIGERPTAAFPSSHVGMSTICMLFALVAKRKWLFWVMLPFWILLVFGTVYIKAHYAIDSIFGLVFAVGFFLLFSWVFTWLLKRKSNQPS